MKPGHLTVMFLCVYLICFFGLSLEQKKYDSVKEEKRKVEKALLEAIQVAGEKVGAAINEPEETKKRIFEQSFLEALYIYLGLYATEENQEYIRMHIPMLVLLEEDGAFFYSLQEISNGTMVEFKHAWSEKKYYSSSEKPVDALLEEKASEIITTHNYIASQYGMAYEFHVPDFVQEFSGKKEFPVLLAVFQGWPLNAAGNVVYENCIDTGAYLRRKKQYVVTAPTDIANAFCVYHEKDCDVFEDESVIILDKNRTLEEVITKYGAYPCSYCAKE